MNHSDYNFDDFCHDAWSLAKGLLLGLVIVLLTLLCLLIWLSARDVEHANQVITDVDRATVITGGAMTDLQKTLALERAAATAQIQATTDTLRQAQSTLATLNRAANNLNSLAVTLNDTAGKAGATIDTLNAAVTIHSGKIADVEDQARAAIADLDTQEKQVAPLLDAGTSALRHVDELAGDPAVRDTLHHIDATTASVDDGTAHIDKWVDDFTAPVRGFWHHARAFLFSVAGPAASVATAAK